MPYQDISEIPSGAIVWVKFLPDLDGLADKETTAEVLGKSPFAVRLRITSPADQARESFIAG